jgi:hypothetical protein
VALKIRDFTAGGGFLFAMCSATDSYDIALAAEGVDICESVFDGDAADPQQNQSSITQRRMPSGISSSSPPDDLRIFRHRQ